MFLQVGCWEEKAAPDKALPLNLHFILMMLCHKNAFCLCFSERLNLKSMESKSLPGPSAAGGLCGVCGAGVLAVPPTSAGVPGNDVDPSSDPSGSPAAQQRCQQ